MCMFVTEAQRAENAVYAPQGLSGNRIYGQWQQ